MQRINIASPRFEYDKDDPEGFRSGMARLGKLLGGAEESGITVYELPPGQAVFSRRARKAPTASATKPTSRRAC